MTEKRIYFTGSADRALGGEIAPDEPSHIHLPRRRRTVRPVDRGESTIWADEEQGGQAHPSIQDA